MKNEDGREGEGGGGLNREVGGLVTFLLCKGGGLLERRG